MRTFRPSYTIPRPSGAKVLDRTDGKWVRFTNANGKEVEGKLSKSGRRVKLEVKDWHCQFRDHNDIERTLKVDPSEDASRRVAATIQDLLSTKTAGGGIGQDLRRRLEGLPARIRNALGEWGLLDEKASMATKPLTELIDLYGESLKAKEKTEKYARNTVADAKTLCEACGFTFYSDIDAAKVETNLKGRRNGGLSYRRSNAILMALKMFCRWMTKQRYVSESPIAHMPMLNVKEDPRLVRRALEIDDLRRLLAATQKAATRHNLTGYERYLVYRLAAETGLRRKELRKLLVSAFHWNTLTIELDARGTKNRKSAVLPLRPDLAAELQTHLANKLPTAKAFNVPDDTAAMIQDDLADTVEKDAAGNVIREAIPYIDEAGRQFDFHALRGQFGSMLANAGVHPRKAQELLRHSDVNLTMNLYSHVLRGQDAEAVASLPDLSVDQQQAALKTGTDGREPPAEILRNPCVAVGRGRTNTNESGQLEASQGHFPADTRCLVGISNPAVGGSNPSGRVSQVLVNPPLTEAKPTGHVGERANLAFHSGLEGEIPADLARLIDAWPTLSDEARAAILRIGGIQ